MPNDQTTKETEILGNIAEILFGSHHHHADIVRAHSDRKTIERRMRLLVESSYWNSVQPQSIDVQITERGYQPTVEEEESLQSLCHYISDQIKILCTGDTLTVLEASTARKRASSNAKTLGILKENQNQVERYLTVLRGLFNDLPEQATTFPNPLRNSRDLSGNDGTEFGIATYSHNGRHYSLRLIVAAVWRAAADENAKWAYTFDSFSKDEAVLTSKENFISVLAECLRAYNQDNGPNPFGYPDNPSCDLGAVERLLLRGAPYNRCFLPSAEDQQNKLFEIQQSVDHYLIDELDNFCTESDKALMFRVLNNRILMDEPDLLSDKAYQAIFKNFMNFLSSEKQGSNDLYAYLIKGFSGFPWQFDRKLNTNALRTLLFELLVSRIELFTSIELNSPNGLMHVENQTSLNRLLMLGSHALINTTWIYIYQNTDEAREFERDRITLKALEELIDTEYVRCALAPGLFYTNKTQQRLHIFFSKCEEISSQFTINRGTNIKEQIDKLSHEKLKNEFAQEITYDTRHIIHYTLTSIDDRLQRLDRKYIGITPEWVDALYQKSLETLWDHLSTQEEPILPIAPHGIRLNQERYQQLNEKQKKQLAWSLHLAKLAAVFEPTNEPINRERDILRGIAAMLGRTLDSAEFEAETFEQGLDPFSGEDIENVFWVTCSIIRELDISEEKKKAAWFALESACKNIDIFSRYISFEDVMEELKDFISKDKNIWYGLPDLFTNKNIEEAQIKFNFDWSQYARPLYKLSDLQGLVLFSLIRFMSALKLEKLHLANKECFSLWCRLFKGNYANLSKDEKRAFNTLSEENKDIKYTVNGLGEFLQKVIQLINQNEKFHAYFAEGIISSMTRSRAEQLVNIVICFTNKPILCPRLSSSLPGKIVLTVLEKRIAEIFHLSYVSVEEYYNLLRNSSFAQYQNAHIIIPGGYFNYNKILKEQKINYTKALNLYVKNCVFPSLGSALRTIDRYVLPDSNLPQSTLFTERLGSSSSERESKRGLQRGLRPG